MDYSINPFGEIWKGGIFNVPSALTEKYIRLASEYQLKALLIILNNSGVCDSAKIAKALGITVSDTEEIMEFWQAEGIVAVNGAAPVSYTVKEADETAGMIEHKKRTEKKSLKISAPTLTPADIIAAAGENSEIAELLNEAQQVLGRTISHSEEEMLVNMVNFYGLKPEIILMILEYWRSEKEKGRAMGAAYVLKIAQNWMDEGIESVAQAEEKLKSVEQSDRIWKEFTALAGIKYKRPTEKQRAAVLGWSADFSMDMIAVAVERAKNNEINPIMPYVDGIIKKWRKNGIKTPADAEREEAEFAENKTKNRPKGKKQSGEISRKPTYDLEKIKKDAMNNTEIKY